MDNEENKPSEEPSSMPEPENPGEIFEEGAKIPDPENPGEFLEKGR